MKKKTVHKNQTKSFQQGKQNIAKLTVTNHIRGDGFAYLVLILLSFIIYSNTLSFDYALDDSMIITKNKFTQDGIKDFKDIMTNDAFTGFFGKQRKLVAGGRYRPLSQLMFAVEKDIFGNKPFAGHLINVILYVLSIVLIYKTLKLLFKTVKSDRWWFSIPFIASVLFAVHPIHTEVVANIKSRDEILSLLFAFLCLYYSLLFIDKKKTIFLVVSGISMFLGLLSKENAITFLAIIPLCYYMFRKPVASEYLISIFPLILALSMVLMN